jgi:hypothetical protein
MTPEALYLLHERIAIKIESRIPEHLAVSGLIIAAFVFGLFFCLGCCILAQAIQVKK